MVFKEALSYDDVLMVPRYSGLTSRSQVSLEVELSKGIKTSTPFIPANMKTVMNREVIELLSKQGSLSLMHRFDNPAEQMETAKWIVEKGYQSVAGMSVGAKEEDKAMADKFVSLGIRILCVDVAHGDSIFAHDIVDHISQKHPEVFLIAGNVATADGAVALWNHGADAVKAGIGAGSICLTRIETGNGVPQLHAIIEMWEAKKRLDMIRMLSSRAESDWEHKNPKRFLIADGGLTTAGNCAKALCFSDLIMAGNLFAGTEEGPGETVELSGRRYKHYDGSSTYKTTHVEGVKALVECKGSMNEVLEKLKDGVSSACSYQGVDNLEELKRVAEFVKITHAGQKESGAHDVKVIG